ncbi:MAG TPA: DUF2071 domain-containing protein [Candidatus Acidoferrales bacterium]|nr:DUF2071 domain-containing protein [Candidatus Acidoferrales bacterium]
MTEFLSAEWRDLVMLNYEVAPGSLKEFVPRGVELDAFDGRTFVSLVGFHFLRTRLFGLLPIPFHTDFDEVNLRFYVRRRADDGDRRGVVFIREIVPKRTIAWVAGFAYGEKYVARPMRHTISSDNVNTSAEYQWQLDGEWCSLHAKASGAPAQPREGSLEQFITEHYWGYAARRDGGCLEYHVSHSPWRVWNSVTAGFDGHAGSLYGFALSGVLRRPPDSAFIADGSAVRVFTGANIAAE